MGKDIQTQESRTTYAPSEFDKEKSETLGQLRGLLFPALTPQLSGAMTSQTEQGLMSANKKGISSAASAGINQGSESLINAMGTGKGDNANALNMALQMYGYAPSSQSSSKSSASPSPMGAAASMGNLGGSVYRAGKEAYNMYKDYTNPDATTPGNIEAASSVNSGAGYTQDPSFTGFTGGAGEAGSYGVLTSDMAGEAAAAGAAAGTAADASYGVLASDMAGAEAGQSIWQAIMSIFEF
jgi:hypothetical protein